MRIKSYRMTNTKIIPLFEGSAAASPSGSHYVGDAKRVGILLRRTNHSSGNGAFAFSASMDAQGTVSPTFSTINMVIDNVTNTNAQTLTRVAGKTLSSNTDALLWLDPAVIVNFLKVACTRTTDGTHSAYLILQT